MTIDLVGVFILPSNKPIIFARFTKEWILGEAGRLLFSLLNSFSSCGYSIVLYGNINCANSGKLGRLTFGLQGLELIDSVPTNYSEYILLCDDVEYECINKPWIKVIKVDYDIFKNRWADETIIFPFPVHPVHANYDFTNKVVNLRKNVRCVKIFFSGDLKGYDKNHISYPAPKLPRLDMVNTILKHMPDKSIFVGDQQEASELFDVSYTNKCVLVDTGKIWLDDSRWLDYLSQVDFFLAPPGICMPMCHNIIEAMAVGAIPVTSYPEWFEPSLKEMKTCITYTSADNLIGKINQVLAMDQSVIDNLRANVIGYYQDHLAPHRFIEQVESSVNYRVEVLMITENFVRNNATKLNAKSVLMRDSRIAKVTWLHRLQRYLFANNGVKHLD